MKLIVQLLMVISLATGALAASTAYHVSLDLRDEQLEKLTLNDDVGLRVTPDGEREPLIKKDSRLTPENIALLRDEGVAFARVKEFSLDRWPGSLVFLVSVIVMAGSALSMRRMSRSAMGVSGSGRPESSPAECLNSACQAVNELSDKVGAADDEPTRLRLIVVELASVGQNQMTAFVEARSQLTGELGLGKTAEIMDRFAAAERQVNRAWSAAADAHMEEAAGCLDTAKQLLADTRELLGRLQSLSATS